MGKIEQISVTEVMPKDYVEYALDVIIHRALPDVRDGFKPVHRRILYAMYFLKMFPETSYRKSARIVGEVLGKYHPHGDSSVYEALVRMAQDFSLRYPLINGHGNFGSVDGDSAAAMRYTEAKLSSIAMEMLEGINKDTVDFIPNFDGEEKEPSVLPSKFPNLLVNGSSGIAVGFACKMPPHNITEVINGVKYRINNENCTLDEIMNFIQAPDFPTGGIIVNPKDIKKIYQIGKGNIILRCKHHIEYIEEKGKEIECIVITEIPYQLNKSKLIESIVDLFKEHIIEEKGKKNKIKAKIPDIADIRDESDREGMRIVIELKKKGDSKRVLNLLYKYSKLQNNFNVNNIALVDGKPPKKALSLIEIIDHYIKHQKEILIRETMYQKNKEEKRLHTLKGIRSALDKLDETIKLIRSSKSSIEAKTKLQAYLSIDESQAESILQMKLNRLTNLEIDNILKEMVNLVHSLEYLNSILTDNNILKKELIKGLEEINIKYEDKRKTQLSESEIINQDLLIEQYNTVIQLTNDGYIKKLRATSVKTTNKNRLKECDYILKEIKGVNKDTIILFSNKGNAYQIKANVLKELKSSELGELISNYHELDKDEKIIHIISTSFSKDEYMISVFNDGKIAKININAFDLTTKTFKYNNNKLINISNITKDTDILLVSSEGKGLVIDTSKINPKQSKNSMGVTAMKLIDNIKCIGSIIGVNKENKITLHTDKNTSHYFMLDDVSMNNTKNWLQYLTGRCGNQGNFIYNTRVKENQIIRMEME